MHNITATFRQHIRMARNNPVASIMVLIIAAVIIGFNATIHQTGHAIAYLAAMWLCMFVTDMVVNATPKQMIGFPVKQPVKKELRMIFICTLLGFAGLCIRFFSDWAHLNGLIKLSVLPLFLFIFPVVIAVVYLFVYKYKSRELGINLNYWYLALIIHLIVGATTLIFAPQVSHWTESYNTMSIPEIIFTGIISAALSEEFLRMLMQTRLAILFKNTGLCFVLASAIWGLMHFPNFSQHYHEQGLLPGLLGSMFIIPVGLMWGYLTHRTKSLTPAVMVHGFNLWGLQNF